MSTGEDQSPELATAPSSSMPTAITTPENERMIPLVIYKPQQLFMAGNPARGFRSNTTGTSGRVSWTGLVEVSAGRRSEVQNGTAIPEHREGRSWWIDRLPSPGWTPPGIGVRRDPAAGPRHRQARRHRPRAEGIRAPSRVVHQTYKSTDAEPRCRVILLLKEPCLSANRFRRGHVAVRHAVVRVKWFAADDFDDQGSDPSRLWYLPMVPPDARYRFEVTDGEPLDLDKLVPNAPPPPRTRKDPTSRATTSKGSAALAWAERRMAETREGHRHTTVFSLAAWLGEMTPPIDEGDIMTALLAHAPDGHDAEFERTIRDGLRRARAA